MSKPFSIGMASSLLFLTAAPTTARVGAEYLKWAKGEFEMPPAIKQAASISDLRPFLDGKDDFPRMAAVRRLGEIEGAEAVGLLVTVFDKQPPVKGLDLQPLVKMEIIRTLGRMGGDKSKSALLEILAQHWEAGPNVQNKRGFYLDGDFASVVPLVLNELYRWNSDEAVFQQAKEIALSEDVAQVYIQPWGIGDNAWKVYLRGLMSKKGYKQEDKRSALFLCDFLSEFSGKGYGDNTLTAVKVRAAEAILEKHSEDTLLSLKKELEAEIREEFTKGQDRSKERCSQLRSYAGEIGAILERKADEKRREEEAKAKEGTSASSQPSQEGQGNKSTGSRPTLMISHHPGYPGLGDDLVHGLVLAVWPDRRVVRVADKQIIGHTYIEGYLSEQSWDALKHSLRELDARKQSNRNHPVVDAACRCLTVRSGKSDKEICESFPLSDSSIVKTVQDQVMAATLGNIENIPSGSPTTQPQ